MIRYLLVTMALASLTAQAQQSVQERLGYPAGTKLLIIHADDLGVSHSENAASIAALEKGSVSSASIMVPCPWFPEIAAYANTHPNTDLGLHLTLTSEWKNYKWGPVSPSVSSLTDDKGYFFSDVAGVGQHGTAADVEAELRAQIQLATKSGIRPSHFDTHMGAVAAHPEFTKAYIRLGRAYKTPVLLPRELVAGLGLTGFLEDSDVLLDKLIMATPADYMKGMDVFYTEAIKSLQPGLNVLLLHAAYDDAEMKAVTIDHPDYGSAWRQADYNFFTSEKCKSLLKEQGIKVITWGEVKGKLYK